MLRNLTALPRYRALIQSLVVRELKARYRGSVLGFFWSFANPLLLLLIYSFVFTVVLPGTRPAETEPYALFMFCGILPWTWFTASLLESSNVLIAGGNLIKKVLFPAEILPVVSVLANMVHFFLGLPILAAFLIYYARPLSVFELAWFPVDRWTTELARVTAVPGDLTLSSSAVPEVLDLPYSLVDSVGEALRAGRSDLVPVLVSQSVGDVRAGGDAMGEAEAAAATSALHAESRGRLRILAAEVSERTATSVGVVSWVLLKDGWHSITPRHDDDGARVTVGLVDPNELATELAPVLAQVTA